MKRIRFIAAAAAVAFAVPAMAASSDYLLVIDGVGGEDSVAAKVSSWSFGASNPTPVGSTGKRESPSRPNPGSSGQDGITPRASQAGSADARKNGQVTAADFNYKAADLDGDGVLDFSEAGKLDQVGPLNLALPARSAVAQELCGDTSHLRSGHIVRSDGLVYDFRGIQAVCTGGDGASVTVSMTGSMKSKEFKGHVTLMK